MSVISLFSLFTIFIKLKRIQVLKFHPFVILYDGSGIKIVAMLGSNHLCILYEVLFLYLTILYNNNIWSVLYSLFWSRKTWEDFPGLLWSFFHLNQIMHQRWVPRTVHSMIFFFTQIMFLFPSYNVILWTCEALWTI